MIGALHSNLTSSSVSQRPSVAGSARAESAPEATPTESVKLSGTRGFFGSALAKTGLALGLATALFCSAAPASAQNVYYYPRPVCGQVQTGQQSGIMIDHRGNVGVYTTQQSVNTCNGTVNQTTVGVNRNGVHVQQQVGSPYGVYTGPVITYPNHGHHHGHHGHHGHHHGHHGHHRW